MRIRTLRCTSCGAPLDAPDGAALVFCDFCRAFEYARPNARVARWVAEPEDQARLGALHAAMGEAALAGDPERWRALAREYYALQLALHPALKVDRPGEETSEADWVDRAMRMGEIAAFDPEVKDALATYAEVSAALPGAGDRVEASRELLEAARRYYELLLAHPRAPEAAGAGEIEGMARAMVRAAVNALAAVLGADHGRILEEVLGDRRGPGEDCPRCGGALPESTGPEKRCHYCGTITRVE